MNSSYKTGNNQFLLGEMIFANTTRDDLFEMSKMEKEIFGGDSFGVFLLENYLKRNILFHKIVNPIDSKIVGFAIVVELVNIYASDGMLADFFDINRIKLKKTAHIVSLLIRKECWNRKIGTTLLEHILAELDNKGFKYIKLEVNTSNSIAINLYLKFNFKIIGKIQKYYNSGQDAYLMVKID